ncbi:MAG TPA: mechanosensitive ion channel family protein [bacterium]|nr:mechanosensitive ion channel family protein [bacterium]
MDATTVVADTSNAVQATPHTLKLLDMDEIFGKIFNLESATKAIRIALMVLIGLIVVGIIVTLIKKLSGKRMDSRTGGFIVKTVQYAGFALILINAFKIANIDLSALLGAAGIAGIALGFAAQTSVSNFISGIFLMYEKTFAEGDIVTVDDTTGVVHSIDALSVKLRTFDNRFVRIPNETLIKTNVINVTRFPLRRLNIKLTVTYDTDIERARQILMETAAANPGVLRKPDPFFMVQSFGANGIDLFLGVWFANSDWEQANNGMYLEIKKSFDAAGIEFAYPTMTIYPKKS